MDFTSVKSYPYRRISSFTFYVDTSIVIYLVETKSKPKEGYLSFWNAVRELET